MRAALATREIMAGTAAEEAAAHRVEEQAVRYLWPPPRPKGRRVKREQVEVKAELAAI